MRFLWEWSLYKLWVFIYLSFPINILQSKISKTKVLVSVLIQEKSLIHILTLLGNTEIPGQFYLYILCFYYTGCLCRVIQCNSIMFSRVLTRHLQVIINNMSFWRFICNIRKYGYFSINKSNSMQIWRKHGLNIYKLW